MGEREQGTWWNLVFRTLIRISWDQHLWIGGRKQDCTWEKALLKCLPTTDSTDHAGPLEIKTAILLQQTHSVPRSWYLTPFCNKRTTPPWRNDKFNSWGRECTRCLEHLTVPESKEVPQTTTTMTTN